jgi:hypothetical protein
LGGGWRKHEEDIVYFKKTLMKINIILYILVITLISACSTHKKILDKVFNENQQVTVNRIIDFYDSFVLNKTDNKLPINEAYLEFLNKNVLVTLDSGDIGFFIPADDFLIPFINSLERKALSEIYFTPDSVRVYDKQIKDFKKVHIPNYFLFNTEGGFMKLLKVLSKKNEFYQRYYKGILTCGDICPTTYSTLLFEYKKINFNNKEERLIFIVPFLFYNKTTADESHAYGR